MTTARNRALDRLRREKRVREKQPLIEAEQTFVALPEEDVVTAGPLADDRLRLIFTCCHPALPPEGRVALTLRLLGGLTTREIAAAFLVSEATAAQRIVRAKRAVRDRRLPYRVPEPSELPARLPSVLEVIYLIFNEGYAARAGETLVRAGLCDEALRLGASARGVRAGSPGGAGAAGADGAALRAAGDARRRAGRPGAARGSGPLALGSRRHRTRATARRARVRFGRPGSLRAPGGDRGLPRHCALLRGDRLAAHRRPLRAAARARPARRWSS